MKIFLVDLESVESRYTCEWKSHVPKLLTENGFTVEVIEGPSDIPSATTPGAFLNFGGTNIYKSAQVEKFSRMFTQGEVKAGDYFLFTDAWHPGIINLKYMSELLGIPVYIGALWHAGSYDPQDFLGRLVGDAPWVRNAEKSFFHAIDHNYFATEFHINLFASQLLGLSRESFDSLYSNKVVRTGWPMEYLSSSIVGAPAKKNLVLFPHRVSSEKQPEIFRDLATHFPDYEFVVCQEQNLSKKEYHQMLAECKLVFSANLQETLGISCYEALCAGALCLVPDRLSYDEMYSRSETRYPSELTQNWDSYLKHKDRLIHRIKIALDSMSDPRTSRAIKEEQRNLEKNYFSAANLIATLRSSDNGTA